MPAEREQLPFDARLLSEAIIELNISRRNVSIYPRGHPSVERSLSKVYEFLHKLFELISEITLAVAKNTLIVDNYFLDRRNPVYREVKDILSLMRKDAGTEFNPSLVDNFVKIITSALKV